MKTAFLLMMATAKQVSEIHALAMDIEHLRFYKTDCSVSLRTQTGLLAKNQLPSKIPSTIFIPNLAKTLTRGNDNRLLYPVRALKCYLDKTKAIRKNRTRLFITIKGDQILQKDGLHGRLHLRSKRHIGNWLWEICHSLKPTNWELCLSHEHTSVAYQLKKSSRLQFGPVRPPLPDSTWETCIGSSIIYAFWVQ